MAMATTAGFITPDLVSGTTTSWLLVTTAYPSLSGCAEAFFLYPGQPYPVAWDPGYGYFAGADLSCLPPQATSWWEQEHQNPDGRTSLSMQPIVCPAAFTTAATEVSGSSTQVMCCPSGYDLAGAQPGIVTGECESTLTSGQTIQYTAQAANASWVSETLTVTSARSINAVAMIGWNVARSTSSSTLATSTSTSTSVPQASHGLSTGAKAAIGLGAILGIVALLAAVFFFMASRRRGNAQHGTYEAAPSPAFLDDSGAVHEMQHKETPTHVNHQNPVELPLR